MAIKNAVTVKNSPNFLSTRTVTTNLTLMNSLTKKQVKQSKIATESKSGDVGCCEWTWRGSGIAIAIADVKQKTTIVFVQSFLQCSTTNPAGWGGASRSTASSEGGVGCGSRGSNFDKIWSKSLVIEMRNALKRFVRFMFCESWEEIWRTCIYMMDIREVISAGLSSYDSSGAITHFNVQPIVCMSIFCPTSSFFWYD